VDDDKLRPPVELPVLLDESPTTARHTRVLATATIAITTATTSL